MTKKRILGISLIVLFIFLGMTFAKSEISSVRVVYNGKVIEDIAYLKNGTTYIEANQFGELLQVYVAYSVDESIVQFKYANQELYMKQEYPCVWADGEILSVGCPMQRDGKYYVPARVVATFFGKEVRFRQVDQVDTIWISDYHLISQEDVQILDDFERLYDNGEVAFYELKDGGVTYRGIHKESIASEVYRIYGKPKSERIHPDGSKELIYETESIMQAIKPELLKIVIKDGRVKQVWIQK